MTYDAREDGRRCYDLAVASMREIEIRSGLLDPSPDNPKELRWRDEGPVSSSQLDTVKESK